MVAAVDIGAIGYYSEAVSWITLGGHARDDGLLPRGQKNCNPGAITRCRRISFSTITTICVLMESLVRNGWRRIPVRGAVCPGAFYSTDFYGTGMILYRLQENVRHWNLRRCDSCALRARALFDTISITRDRCQEP
jgi:hypothetical protein